MKSLEELYEEVRKNPKLISAFTEAVEKNQLDGFLKEQSCDASLEEAQTFLTAQLGKTQALSDEELDNVAGGKGEPPFPNPLNPWERVMQDMEYKKQAREAKEGR